MTGREPTSVVPLRASTLTSPLALLAEPNLPAAENDADEPFVGTVSVTLGENAPEPPLRN